RLGLNRKSAPKVVMTFYVMTRTENDPVVLPALRMMKPEVPERPKYRFAAVCDHFDPAVVEEVADIGERRSQDDAALQEQVECFVDDKRAAAVAHHGMMRVHLRERLFDALDILRHRCSRLHGRATVLPVAGPLACRSKNAVSRAVRFGLLHPGVGR